MELWFKQLQF